MASQEATRGVGGSPRGNARVRACGWRAKPLGLTGTVGGAGVAQGDGGTVDSAGKRLDHPDRPAQLTGKAYFLLET